MCCVMSMETILENGMECNMGLTLSPYLCTYTMTESKVMESTMHLYVCLLARMQNIGNPMATKMG